MVSINDNSNTHASNQTFDWAYDRYYSKSIWLNRCVVMIVILTLLLLLSVVSNIFLLPLKEKIPYLYAFDHATGSITRIGELTPTQLSGNWQLTKYFITHYIVDRESYDINHLNEPYQRVRAQSADDVRQQYVNEVSSNNDHSPYHRYGKEKYVTVKVLAINRFNNNTVDIKFEKTLHDRTTGSTQQLQKEAIIKFAYTQPKTSEQELLRDPLGFQVTYYQTSSLQNIAEGEKLK